MNDKDRDSRKTRSTRQQSRNNPNSKLLNAAWPKAPSNPTRKSHIKTVDHEPFTRSWNEWRQKKSECFVEDMEVDMEESHVNKSIASSKQPEKDSKQSSVKSVDTSTLKLTAELKRTDGKPVSRARRCQSEEQKTKNEKILADEAKKITDNRRKSSVKSLFIVIHVNQVQLGLLKGPATTPVKVFADKFIIQMEDESTKKEISFRVPCKDILTLHVNLQQKPFTLAFTTKTIHYNSGGPQKSKSKEQEIVSITLNLAYDENVPSDVKEDLKELFHVRLAAQNLWPKQAQSSSPKKPVESQTGTKSPVKEQDKPPSSSSENEEARKKILTPVKRKQGTKSNVNNGKANVKKETATGDVASSSSSLTTIGRKRTPPIIEEGINEAKANNHKVARRSNSELSDSMEKRIETLEHEAAHYQMVTAQQRMIIQSLESNVRSTAEQAEKDSRLLEEERDVLSEEYSSKQVEITTILNNLKIEKDLVRALESQLESCRTEIDLKNSIIAEKSDALRVREETILELRSRVRTLSTAEAQQAKRANEMVSKTDHDDLSERLQEIRSEREILQARLRQKEQELNREKRQVLALRSELESLQIELSSINETNSSLRTNYETMRRHKDEQIQSLETSVSQRIDQESNTLRDELANTRIQVEELQSELADTKSQLEITEELNKSSGHDTDQPSRDWILGRGEIVLTDTVLGTGAWGNVKVGKFRGTRVAVKQIHQLILSPHNRRLFEREMSIASRCRHPCLVQFIGATNDDGTPLFVMELLKTDLRSCLTRTPLPHQDCLNIAYDVICAIVYLHKSKPVPIIHRDISSSNILLHHGETGWRAKLSDYGAANFLRLSMTRHPGALLYSAPEASTVDQSTKLDVYSFGVLFCEMCTRELPVPENRRDQIRNVSNVEYRTLINNCLRRDVAKRLDSYDVLQVLENWIEP